MDRKFVWNPHSDQPDNVASRKERRKAHFRNFGCFVDIFKENVKKSPSILSRYRRYRNNLYASPVTLDGRIAISVSPTDDQDRMLTECLKETGVRRTLVRIPSWESHRVSFYQDFIGKLLENRFEVGISLLQHRADVLDPSRWDHFIQDVFGRFQSTSSFFEIGHAWNRTKWGVWSFREYLDLARPAVVLARECGATVVGPAIIDFEFHLCPPVLREVSFDHVSALLYVDRVGAPENTQFGWDTPRKVALLRAFVDSCDHEGKGLWVSEVNWPLRDTGKYSPVSGRPNVSETEQADYLVRYYLLALASGCVDRVYWWQLVAPGYGLIDSRYRRWRKRPSYFAFKNMIEQLADAVFQAKGRTPGAEVFLFRRGEESIAVGWTRDVPCEWSPPGRILRVLERDGQEVAGTSQRLMLGSSPRYIFFEN